MKTPGDRMRRILFIIPALIAVMAFAQAPPDPKAPTTEDLLITASQLETILKNAPVSKDTGKPGEVSSKLLDGGTFSVAFIRLNEPDKPHTHAQSSEVYVIKEGSGALETGGTMIGPFTSGGVHHQASANAAQRPATPGKAVIGDRAGTAIDGGRTQTVNAGDVVFIPAGVPHTWTKVDQPMVYFDIKFPKAE
jgi:mannose-6-phosphate isomerase-like protein (cupin superfamily)